MKAILFGATGMVGQGVLRECLLDPEVTEVLAVTRQPLGREDPKLHAIVQADVADLAPLEDRLRGYDACFYCLGISSIGMTEADYRRVTCELTVAIAGTLVRLNPGMTFIFISGSGADSSERGRVMWARVKGATENALFAMPFKAVHVFRPGAIQPRHGIVSKTGVYRIIYRLLSPLFSLLRALFPAWITTTERLGKAMIRVAKQGSPKRIIENRDIEVV